MVLRPGLLCVLGLLAACSSGGSSSQALDPTGKYLLAASYNGGDVAVFPVRSDGALDPRVDAEAFGAGAQSHSVRVDPSGKWAFVPTPKAP